MLLSLLFWQDLIIFISGGNTIFGGRYFLKMPKQKFSVAFLDALIMLIGTFIAAMALDIFLIPYKIASGGASSVGLIVNYLTSGMIPVGVTIILVNIPLFFLGYKNMGLSYLLKSILGTLLYSLFIDSFY